MTNPTRYAVPNVQGAAATIYIQWNRR